MAIPKFMGRDCELSTSGVDARGRALQPWDVTRAVLDHIDAAFQPYGTRTWSRPRGWGDALGPAAWGAHASAYSSDCLRHWTPAGGCAYSDMAHLEVCTPATLHPRSYAAHCFAALWVVDAARQRLMLWDLPPEEIAALDETKQAREAITFRSPVSGYVLEKQALTGMRVMPGQTLYTVADLSVVWVEADVYEQEMPLARVGQRATVTLDAYPGEFFAGRAIYIYPFVEENTRTVKVRFQFPNARGRLKPGMFAHVEMQGARSSGLTVPADAVLDSGTQQFVFVARGEGLFTPTPVTIGRRFGDRIELVTGVAEGEQVAAGATFFLDSESQLRAGLQNYEPGPGTGDRGSGIGDGGSERAALAIGFRSLADPPKTGENIFEVTVKDPAGQPVADADVTVQLFMPAMPTMNMPAMRSEAKLAPAGGGLYRGPGQVAMSGRWEVTVAVSRAGRRIASRQFALIVR